MNTASAGGCTGTIPGSLAWIPHTASLGIRTPYEPLPSAYTRMLLVPIAEMAVTNSSKSRAPSPFTSK